MGSVAMEPVHLSSILCVGVCLLLSPATGYITFIAERMPLQGERAPPGSPWPMPSQWSRDTRRLTLDPATFDITSNVAGCDVMAEAAARYKRIVLLEKARVAAGVPVLRHLAVEVDAVSCPQWPHQDMKETYELRVSEDASLRAASLWGVLRGLETFSQLIYTEDGVYRINRTHVKDSPRFPYRGSHIDTSRHFLPMQIIIRHLDAMAYNKMNVLHWHIVDAQAFPYVSTTYPELSAKGAYVSNHVYTPSDVRRVINYARMRGIRVIPEFDTPGHAHSWGKAFPTLLTECWAGGKPGVATWGQHWRRENFDPSRNATYRLLERLLAEVRDVFPDEFVHLGQDEAHYMCWESSPNITAFLRELGYHGNEYNKVEEYFSRRVLDLAARLNIKPIIWQDPVDHGVKIPSTAVVEVWKSDKPWQAVVANMTSEGHHVIVASPWYLNVISYGEDWRTYYNVSLDFLDAETRSRLLGGEACMWGEYVDGTNFLQRYWPRASAVAERLWSAGDVTDLDRAAFRLDQQRCRMLRRGVPAPPLLPGYCGDWEWGMQLGEDPLADVSPPTQCTCPSHPSVSSGHHPLLPLAPLAPLALALWGVVVGTDL